MLSFFARSNSAYDVGAVCETVFGIACGDSTGEALIDDTSMFPNSEILDCILIRLESPIGREGP